MSIFSLCIPSTRDNLLLILHSNRSITPKSESVSAFNACAQELLKRTVWVDDCPSWYKNGKEHGPIKGPYGGSISKLVWRALGMSTLISSASINPSTWLVNGQSLRD